MRSFGMLGMLAAATVVGLLAGCGGKASDRSAPTPGAAAEADAAAIAPPSVPYAGDPVVERALLDALVGSKEGAEQAIGRVVAAGDARFVAPLIELLRMHELAWFPRERRAAVVDALETLSGVALGLDWDAWVEWYGTTELEVPAGFTGWKGELLGRIDDGFAEFLFDGAPSRERVEEVVWGGVAVDGIPALDDPPLVSADEAEYLTPEDPVFGLVVNGEAHAYPTRILDWHELVNTTVGGVPVSLAYCTLCGAGIAYDGRASDGATYTFGSSGLLFRSNKLMYDRTTRTLWNQFTGTPTIGTLAATDVELTRLPTVLTSWEAWLEQHPDTRVLSLDTGYERPYFPGVAYGQYFSSDTTMFPVWQRRDDLAAKERVFGLERDGLAKAYPLGSLVAEGVVNDEHAGVPNVLLAPRGTVEVWPDPVDYEVGGEVRAYERGSHTFTASDATEAVVDEHGERWSVTEEALIGPDDERLARLDGHLAYWFGWFAFYPRTELYEGTSTARP